MQNSLLLAGAGNHKGEAKQAVQKHTAQKSGAQQAKGTQTKQAKMTSKKHTGAKRVSKTASAKGLKHAGIAKQKTAQHSQQQLCAVACGGDTKQQAACKCPTTHTAKAAASPADGFMSFVRELRLDATASKKQGGQKLRQVGVAVDADPFDEVTPCVQRISVYMPVYCMHVCMHGNECVPLLERNTNICYGHACICLWT